jgi:hypothetical protein
MNTGVGVVMGEPVSLCGNGFEELRCSCTAYLLMKEPLMGSTVYGMWSLVCHHLVTASEWSVRYPTLKKTNTGTSTVLL